MEPVTQLYVSVDASTKESLKRIDRPLFKDFWQRFLDSLKALSEKVPGYEYFLFPILLHVTFSARSGMAKGSSAIVVVVVSSSSSTSSSSSES